MILDSTNSESSIILATNQSLPLDHQYFYFIVQPFNIIGPGYNSSALKVILKVPDTPDQKPYCGALTSTSQLHIRWDSVWISQGNVPIQRYEIFISDESHQSGAYFMILSSTAPNFNMFNFIYRDNITSRQAYLVKYRAVNSLGPGLFSPIATIYATDPPRAKESLVVE